MECSARHERHKTLKQEQYLTQSVRTRRSNEVRLRRARPECLNAYNNEPTFMDSITPTIQKWKPLPLQKVKGRFYCNAIRSSSIGLDLPGNGMQMMERSTWEAGAEDCFAERSPLQKPRPIEESIDIWRYVLSCELCFIQPYRTISTAIYDTPTGFASDRNFL